MDLGCLLNELLQLNKLLPEEDLLDIIKSTVTLFVLCVLNMFLDGSFEAEDNELFVKVGSAFTR